MRGVKYNSSMQLRDGSTLNFDNLNMKDTCEMLRGNIKHEYGIDMSITPNKLYNIMKRPHCCSSILKDTMKLQIEKAEKEI